MTEEEFLKQYKPSKYERPSVTVDMLILCMSRYLDNLKVLLIQRKNHPYINCWALAGGFVGIHESTYDAACRELQEEADSLVKAGVIDQHYKIANMFKYADRRAIAEEIFTLSGINDKCTIKPVDEIEEAKN